MGGYICTGRDSSASKLSITVLVHSLGGWNEWEAKDLLQRLDYGFIFIFLKLQHEGTQESFLEECPNCIYLVSLPKFALSSSFKVVLSIFSSTSLGGRWKLCASSSMILIMKMMICYSGTSQLQLALPFSARDPALQAHFGLNWWKKYPSTWFPWRPQPAHWLTARAVSELLRPSGMPLTCCRPLFCF